MCATIAWICHGRSDSIVDKEAQSNRRMGASWVLTASSLGFSQRYLGSLEFLDLQVLLRPWALRWRLLFPPLCIEFCAAA